MKRLLPIAAVLLALLLGTTVYFGVHAFADRALSSKVNPTETICNKTGVTHQVLVQNGSASPAHTEAKICDRLTITNKDDQIRLVAFGVHDSHKGYDGMVERALEKSQSMTVTLNQAGTYRYHDHLQDEVQGTFTVHR